MLQQLVIIYWKESRTTKFIDLDIAKLTHLKCFIVSNFKHVLLAITSRHTTESKLKTCVSAAVELCKALTRRDEMGWGGARGGVGHSHKKVCCQRGFIFYLVLKKIKDSRARAASSQICWRKAPGNIIQPVIEMCQRLSLKETMETGKREGLLSVTIQSLCCRRWKPNFFSTDREACEETDSKQLA